MTRNNSLLTAQNVHYPNVLVIDIKCKTNTTIMGWDITSSCAISVWFSIFYIFYFKKIIPED